MNMRLISLFGLCAMLGCGSDTNHHLFDGQMAGKETDAAKRMKNCGDGLRSEDLIKKDSRVRYEKNSYHRRSGKVLGIFDNEVQVEFDRSDTHLNEVTEYRSAIAKSKEILSDLYKDLEAATTPTEKEAIQNKIDTQEQRQKSYESDLADTEKKKAEVDTVDMSSLNPAVESCEDFITDVRVLKSNGYSKKYGVVMEVYKNHTARVRWDGDKVETSFEELSALKPEGKKE